MLNGVGSCISFIIRGNYTLFLVSFEFPSCTNMWAVRIRCWGGSGGTLHELSVVMVIEGKRRDRMDFIHWNDKHYRTHVMFGGTTKENAIKSVACIVSATPHNVINFMFVRLCGHIYQHGHLTEYSRRGGKPRVSPPYLPLMINILSHLSKIV